MGEIFAGERPALDRRGDPWLLSLSRRLAQLETVIAAWLLTAVFALLLLNAATRSLGTPLYWVDELAIFGMIWAGFLGASAALEARRHIAVTLLADMLGQRGRIVMRCMCDLILLAFFIFLALVCWWWYAPLELARSASLAEFSARTFNFIYQEPSTTLPIPKFIFWLIVPVFALCGSLHCAAQALLSFRAFGRDGV